MSFDWLILAVAAIFAWAAFCRWLDSAPRPGDPMAGLLYRVMQLYAKVYHHLQVTGAEHIPSARDPGPLIIVVNHTAGVDPVLVQSAFRFEVRWVMANDMQLSKFDWFWQWGRVISVDRGGGDVAGTREAIRHLQAGGVLGIFPEGGIERPPRQIRPFLAGVGLLIKKTKARVLPLIIDGTPTVDPAWASLKHSSHSRVTIKPMLDYSKSGMKAADIADDLRRRYLEWTGWPANDAAKHVPGEPLPGY
jgi:1-acyl-sn-glycerol-3-phosphate acyltransferase